jgi:hypothetical protein
MTVSTFRRYRVLCLPILSCFLFVTLADAQLTDNEARARARTVTAANLHFDPAQFVGIERQEELEQSYAVATRIARGTLFLYKLWPGGEEVRDSTIINHCAGNCLSYLVGVRAVDGAVFRIRGFSDSIEEFNRMMGTNAVHMTDHSQAHAFASFYRSVNPESLAITPLWTLLDFKQMVEQQCHDHQESFLASDEQFTKWWNSHKSTYLNADFSEGAFRDQNGFRMEFLVMPPPAANQACGGAPVLAVLQITPSGQIDKLAYKESASRIWGMGIHGQQGVAQ